MKLLEYQGKELFKQYDIRIPSSHLVSDIEQAKQAARKLGYPCILKSQLSVGGRGKAGAILKCKTESQSGIGEYLFSGQQPVIVETNYHGLDLLTAGKMQENPSDLLSHPRLSALLDTLKEQYEVIIMDTPPVGIVADYLLFFQQIVRHLLLEAQLFLDHFSDTYTYHLHRSSPALSLSGN